MKLRLFHDFRREGDGTFQDPIRRTGGYCAVEGCLHYGPLVRVTPARFHVGYCATHSQEASLLFGEPEAAAA